MPYLRSEPLPEMRFTHTYTHTWIYRLLHELFLRGPWTGNCLRARIERTSPSESAGLTTRPWSATFQLSDHYTWHKTCSVTRAAPNCIIQFLGVLSTGMWFSFHSAQEWVWSNLLCMAYLAMCVVKYVYAVFGVGELSASVTNFVHFGFAGLNLLLASKTRCIVFRVV